jgi:hypothetical protein
MLQTERVPTGILGLDSLIEGGFPQGRSILITGEPGTGKSIFALQFLAEGLKRNEKCIFVSADENPMDIWSKPPRWAGTLSPISSPKDLAILNAGTYLSSFPGASKERHIDVQRAVSDLASLSISSAPRGWCSIPPGPLCCCAHSRVRIQDQIRLLIKLMRSSLKTTNVLTSYAVPRTGERSACTASRNISSPARSCSR